MIYKYFARKELDGVGVMAYLSWATGLTSSLFMQITTCSFLSRSRVVVSRVSLCLWAALFFTSSAFSAEQTLDLVKGWNAVYLELQPDSPNPQDLFADQPIEVVAVWLPSKARVTSLTSLDAIASKSSEWYVWHPAEHPAAFLNSLFQIQARKALLIKASAATQLTIQGEPVFGRRKWLAPSFNLTGFDVDSAAPPTFARFFDGSRAHEDLKIFKMVANEWRQVSPTDTIQRGRAYWVWTKEGSDFQGPLDVSVSLGGQETLILNGASTAQFEVHGNGSLPVSFSLEASTLGVLEYRTSQSDEWTTAAPQQLAVDTASAYGIRLRQANPEAPSATYLKLSGGGMLQWLPVHTGAE